MLGLDFGGTKIAVAVCDLAGNKLASAIVEAGGEHGAQVSFGRGIAAARDLLAQTAPDSRLAAVGVSTFGIPLEDGVELAPAIDGWSELRLGRELRAEFPGTPVAMTTDAKAAARAEARWGSLAGCDPAVYVNLGTGLATAIVAGGQVVVGSHGAAGEIGYNLRSVADVGLGLDQRTMLEQMVSGQGLSSRVSPAGDPMTAAAIFAAEPTDPALADLVDEFIDELAFHIVNVAILIDPARIAVGGGMVGSWDRIAPRLRAALDAAVPYPPELVLAKFPQEAPLLGAVALAVDAAATATEPADHRAPLPRSPHHPSGVAQELDAGALAGIEAGARVADGAGAGASAGAGLADPAAASWAANSASASSASMTPAQEGAGGSAVQVSTVQISPSTQMDAQPGAANGPVISNQGIAV